MWDGYFAKSTPSPRAVALYIQQLQDARKHDHIVAMLESALIHGQSQPWMYDALAISMEAIGRPADEIERVLLSSVDFATFDIPSLLYSATYLANFGREKRALLLCRQAARIDPTRPEPYALGLKLAQKVKDDAAIRWAATGTLSRVWTRNYADLHKEAERVAIDLEGALRKAGNTAEADLLARELSEAKQRDLVITLSWSGTADLELLVEEPSGTICKFNHSRTSGGGVFVHDGYGPDPKNTYEQYLCPRGMSGDYRVIVRYLWGDVVGKKAELKITRYQGTPEETTESLFVSIGQQDKRYRVPLNKGRLKEPLPPPVLDDLLADRPRKKFNMHALAQERPRGETARALAAQGGQLARQFVPAGFQPVITVLNDGVTMQAQAVISADRRYVRMTLSPVFSALTDVQTFSFFQGLTGNTGGGGQQPTVP